MRDKLAGDLADAWRVLPTPGSEARIRELQSGFEDVNRTLAAMEKNRAQFAQAEETARALGAKFEIADIGEANGKYENGTIIMNPYTENPARQVLVHELTHHIETSGQYDALQSRVLEFIGQDMQTDVNAMLEAVTRDYAARGVTLTQDGARRELVAKFCEEKLFTDEKSIERLARTEPGLFQRIREWISDTIAKLRGTRQENALREMERLYEKAARSTGEQAGYQGAQYSIETDANGDKFVDVTDDILEGKTEKDHAQILRDIIRNKFGNIIQANGQIFAVNSKTSSEWRRSKSASSLYQKNNSAYLDKIRVFNNADELMSASHDYVGEGLKHPRKDRFVEFARGKVNYRVGNNGYTADIVVGIGIDGRADLYDIVNIRDKKITEARILPVTEELTSSPIGGASVNISIPQTGQDGNPSGQNPAPELKGIARQREYREAVERGDLARAQELLREKAGRKGYTGYDTAAERQNHIIQAANSATDDYHTWIRGADEVKSFAQTLDDPDWAGVDFDPDYTWEMAQDALRSGEITVYSSYPVGTPGGFVTPSRMEAEGYAGDGEVYQGTVKLDDVAWIDPTQGQYAPAQAGDLYKAGSANPKTLDITYDNGGKLIPLSQRFDETNPDRRYSMGMTFGQLRDARQKATSIDTNPKTHTPEQMVQDEFYRKQIDGAFDGSLPSGRKITLGETPEIIQQYGANAREMTMTQTVARKIAYPTGYLGLKHGHNLGMSALKNLPQQLRDPIAILKNPQPNASGADSVIILTEWNDKNGNPIVVPIQLDVTGALDVPENVIASTFGAEYIDRLLGVNDGNVMYTKNGENIRQLLSNGRPMPEAMADDIFAKFSMPQAGAEVKGQPQGLPLPTSFPETGAGAAGRNIGLPTSFPEAAKTAYSLPLPQTQEVSLPEAGKTAYSLPLPDALTGARRQGYNGTNTNEGGTFDGRERTKEDFGREPKTLSGDAGRAQGGRPLAGTEPGTHEEKSSFLQRNAGEGRETASDGKVTWAYQKTPDAQVSETARTASSILQQYGISSVVYDGNMEINNGTETRVKEMVAGTSGDGTVYISNAAGMDPVEIAGHEKFHSFAKKNPQAIETFYESALEGNLNYADPEFNHFVEQIGEAYIGADYDVTDPAHWAKIREEFAAYLSGYREVGDSEVLNGVTGFFHDWSRVESGYAALDALSRGQAGQPQGGTFGRNTVGAAQAGTEPKRRVSRVSSNTFTESGIFNDAEKRSLEIFDREGGALYDVVSEKTSLQNAKDRLETDYEGEASALPGKKDFNGEDNDTAMGILSRKLEEARKSGDYTEVEKWAKLIKEKGTQGGQFIQSFAKYTRTPEGAMVQGQREVDAAVKLWETKNPKAIPKLQKQGYLVWTKDDMKQVAGLMQQAQDAGLDSPQGRTFEAQAMAVIAKRLPVKNKNKVISLLMDNMLGNFRTLISRNAGGNLVFTAPEALRENLIAAPVDALASLATKQRTTYFDPAGKSAAWARGFAKGGADMASDIKTGVHTARSGETASIQAQQKTFRDKGIGKVLNAYDAFVGTMLEAGDRPFYEGAYAAKMRDLEHARKQGKLTKDFEGKDFDAYAPLVARQAALEAVFQDDGAIAKGLGKIAEAMKLISEGTTGAGFLNQAAMPFTKTPGNLAERAIEYSPIGAVKNALRTGSEIRRGTFNQQRFVNETSRNLIGSGLLVLAGKLVDEGIVQGSLSDDKDEREAQKNAGMQDYSVKIGENYVSYAWIPVIGPALAGGADFYQTLDGSGLGALAAVGDAAAGYVQSAVFEQSALSGLSEMFSGDNAAKGVVDTALSLPSQFVPSMVRQVAAAADPYERQTYVSGDQIQSQLGSLKSAIPGLRQTLPIKRDEQGEVKQASQGRSALMRTLETMLLPAKITKDVSNDVRDELSRLKRETGETRQFQNKVTYAVERDGVKIPLTPAQSMDYQKDFGKASTDAIRKLMHSGAYDALSDGEKVEAISSINSYAKKLADAKYTSVKFENSEKRMKDAGISPGIWYGYSKMKSVLNREKDPETNWKVTERVLADEGLSRTEKDAVLENLVIAGISEESAEKYAEEYKGVMKPETYIRLRSEYAKIKKQFEGEDNAAGKRQAAWISYLDRTGLPAEQRAKVEEDIKFWSMFPAKPESTSFDMLGRYGGKNEKANAAAMENAGLSIGQYYAAKEYKSGLEGDGQKERVLAWMRGQGWTDAQIRAAGSALGYKMSSGKKGGSKKFPYALPTSFKLPKMKTAF